MHPMRSLLKPCASAVAPSRHHPAFDAARMDSNLLRQEVATDNAARAKDEADRRRWRQTLQETKLFSHQNAPPNPAPCPRARGRGAFGRRAAANACASNAPSAPCARLSLRMIGSACS